jgi:hypothetical protein
MKFEHDVVIYQTVEKVFEFVTDIRNNAKWQTDILELEMTSEGPLGIGSTYRCANRFMGMQIETEGVVTDYVIDSIYSIKITSGSVRGANSFLFEEVQGGTKLTAKGNLDMGYFKLAKMIAKRKVHQQLKKDMLKLKHLLENGQQFQETTDWEPFSAVR